MTAATSSPLTDGASCVLVMSEEKAIELGCVFPLRALWSFMSSRLCRVPCLLSAVTQTPPPACGCPCSFATDIVVRAFATTAIDPFPQLLLAPALAIPKALDLAGMSSPLEFAFAFV